MSHEDNKPKGSEPIDPVSKEWGRIIDAWRNMQKTGAPVEFSHLKALFLLKAEKDKVKSEKAKVEIVTTIGAPNPDTMEAIARNLAGDNRNKLQVLETAIFEPTSGPIMFTQELRFATSKIDDFSSGVSREGYHVLRVRLRDDAENVAVSIAVKPIDSIPEEGIDHEFIQFSSLRENPQAVTDTMNAYFHIHAPVTAGVR